MKQTFQIPSQSAFRLHSAKTYPVEIGRVAAVIVTNISSKLLISRLWQLITIHTSGKHLEHTKHAHTHTQSLRSIPESPSHLVC